MKINAKDIKVSFLRKDGRKATVLNVPELEIGQGEVTVIFGRSGSGKTTLISVLSGLQKPSEGNVYYDETDLYELTDDAASLFRNKNIGFIPQGQSLLVNLTVRENILISAGISKEDRAKQADSLIKEMDIVKLADSYPGELSGGEARRCAIARALINEPSVIFADEPTGDLDDHNTEKVFELLRMAAKKGASVVVVTHESQAKDYADRIYRMEDGRLETH